MPHDHLDDAGPIVDSDGGVDAFVAIDCQLVVLKGHVEENPVAVGRLMHLQQAEHMARTRQGVVGAVFLDVDADFARGHLFGLRDGRLDAGLLIRREGAFVVGIGHLRS